MASVDTKCLVQQGFWMMKTPNLHDPATTVLYGMYRMAIWFSHNHSYFFFTLDTYQWTYIHCKDPPEGCFLVGGCSIRIFAKNMGDPYYEPTIVIHDKYESVDLNTI